MVDLYFLGYYIHSCVKMRYKGTYKPTYVLGRCHSALEIQKSDLLIEGRPRKPHLGSDGFRDAPTHVSA